MRTVWLIAGLLGLFLLPAIVLGTFARVLRTAARARGLPPDAVGCLQRRARFWSGGLMALVLAWWSSAIGCLLFRAAFLLWTSRGLCALCAATLLLSVADIRRKANGFSVVTTRPTR